MKITPRDVRHLMELVARSQVGRYDDQTQSWTYPAVIFRKLCTLERRLSAEAKRAKMVRAEPKAKDSSLEKHWMPQEQQSAEREPYMTVSGVKPGDTKTLEALAELGRICLKNLSKRRLSPDVKAPTVVGVEREAQKESQWAFTPAMQARKEVSFKLSAHGGFVFSNKF